MKFSLADRVQEEIGDACPEGWRCRREVAVLQPDIVRLLGYRPTADVLLESENSRSASGSSWRSAAPTQSRTMRSSARRIIISPFPPTDSFVSLVSNDVVAGRANLAAHATFMLRRIGLSAFQMTLFPGIEAERIKRMNQGLEVAPALPVADVQGVIRMTRGIEAREGVRIHYAATVGGDVEPRPVEPRHQRSGVQKGLGCATGEVLHPRCGTGQIRSIQVLRLHPHVIAADA